MLYKSKTYSSWENKRMFFYFKIGKQFLVKLHTVQPKRWKLVNSLHQNHEFFIYNAN